MPTVIWEKVDIEETTELHGMASDGSMRFMIDTRAVNEDGTWRITDYSAIAMSKQTAYLGIYDTLEDAKTACEIHLSAV